MYKKTITHTLRALRIRRHFLSGSIVEYILVGAFFLVLSGIYTSFSILSGNSTLFISEPGDATAGITWSIAADNDLDPLFGWTDSVNYPAGVQLSDASQITALTIIAPLWVLSKVFSAFMATNILQLCAFLLVSMSVYLITKRLTNKWYVGIFAGFAAAFFPYHLFKSVNHIGNIFSWVFALELASFLYLWRRPSWRASWFAASSIAIGYYTDGYYLLISSVFAVTLTIGLILASIVVCKSKAHLLNFVRYIVVSAGVVVVLTLPIIAMQVSSGSGVSETLGRSTSTIKTELSVYASKLVDFLAPPAHSPFFSGEGWYRDMLRVKANRSNPVESTLYIGYIVLLLCGVGVAIFIGLLFKPSMVKKFFRLSHTEIEWLTALSLVLIITIPVLLSFMGPDKITKFGITLPTLAGILTDHIALWRVLARFILPLHILLVVYAAFILFILQKNLPLLHKRNILHVLVTTILLVLTAIEYATTINTPLFNINKMPAVYSYLQQREDIKVIAELPMQDQPLEVNGYYATAQYIHKKKLLNNHLGKINKGQYSALGTESNPETIDFINQRGADAVITRAKECRGQKWGLLLYREKVNLKSVYGAPPSFAPSGSNYICLYKLIRDSSIDKSFVITSAMYAREDTGDFSTSLGTPEVTLKIADSLQRPIKNRRAKVSLNVYSTGKLPYSWSIVQDDRVIATGNLSGDASSNIAAIVDTNSPIIARFMLNKNGGIYTPEDLRVLSYASTLTLN